MEIKDLIKCENDDIIPIQSKMIANLLLSGSSFQLYTYSFVSDEIYKKYNNYIRYNKRFDDNIYKKNNVAPRDVGYYAGEVSKICEKLGLPLISVNIYSKDGMPNDGFFTFSQCKEMIAKGISKNSVVKQIRQDVYNALEDGLYSKLINYLNNTSNENNLVEQNSNIGKHSANKTATSNSNINNYEDTISDEKSFLEGRHKELIMLLRERNQKVVKLVKQRDNYTCQACGFFYFQKIVEAHHLNPMSYNDDEYEVNVNDLITLCPTCHSLAHILLNEDEIYTDKDTLINTLKNIINA